MHAYTSHCLIVLELLIVLQIGYVASNLPEDAKLNTTALGTKYGHPPLYYEVETEDGYILTIYRLPGRDKIPILLAHGYEDSSDIWFLRGNNSLAIRLAEAGCDVWLANSRGNRYSRRHKLLDPDTDPEFWRFSFNELGYYDLPAIIDTILNETGADKISAIGHSQGTTIFYALGSERPEYNAKINVMISLAPVAYLQNNPIHITAVIQLSPFLAELAKILRIYEFFGDSSSYSKLYRAFCTTPIIGYKVCAYGAIFLMMGYDPPELEPEFFPVAVTHFPAGSSSLAALHLMQIGVRKIFAKYDYGSEVNQKLYNSTVPPEYPLNNVTMPIALFTAKNDFISTIPDVAILRGQLPNVVYYFEHPRPKFNHLDYVVGKNAHVYLHPYIYSVLNKYNHTIYS